MRLLAFLLLIALICCVPASAAGIKLGSPTQVPTPAGKFTMPSFSADGHSIAFSRRDFGGLYTTDGQGSFHTIAEAPMAGWRYSWTADGQNLAYRVRYEDTSAMAGMVSSSEGGAQTQVTDWQNDLFPPTSGKNGITFRAGDDILTVDEKGEVKSVKSVSDGQGIVSRVTGVSLAFCASNLTGGTLSAFAVLVPAAFGKGNAKDVMTNADNELWVVDENGEPKKLIDIKDEPGYFSPQTSPDGDAVAANGLSGKLYVADMAGGPPIDLGIGQDPAWSPDGRYLVYEVVSEDGHNLTGSDLWIASRDGKWKQRLTNTDGLERYPSFSPDGRTIIYETDGKIYTAPVEQ